MNKRQQEIFAAIIEEYTETAIPVGSKVLVEKYGFDMSPATIRNDMNKLEEDGFLHQPHISAGRIPTDKGYKYFVEEIMGDTELSLADQKKLQTELLKLKAQNQRLSRTTAKLLSGLSGNLAISTIEKDFSEFGIKELLGKPEFQEVDEFCKVAEALDYIDENIDFILKNVKDNETKIFIGKDNPIKGIPNCSLVVSPYKTKSGQKGVLAIIGPKRMKYAENKSLLNYVRKMLSTSVVIFAVVISNL
ncbi:MAG: Transcriptional regulator of heat shock protein [Candidatus Moranbacteria bacterium GW2011_GWA2_39_41]|nr:MAG: Transcriptional regulator of heat shock protein [Candidatus Moranbacteria bacterium GW2011_GWA2_39_41]